MKTAQKPKEKYNDVIVDSSLNKYANVVLFPKKLELANERLKKSGPPKLPINR